jgi:RNA polymerase primary sigma factor
LTEPRETELAVAARNGERESRDTLIEANLRLVVFIARGYQGCGLPLEDLVSEGTLGLIQAVDRFDPAYGRRLSVYASHWIRMTIRRALNETASTIRLPSYMVKLLSKWRTVEREIARESGGMQSDEATASAMGLGFKKRSHVSSAQIARRLRSGAVSGPFEEQIEHCLDPHSAHPIDQVVLAEDLERLRVLFGMLKPCECLVLSVRYGLDGSQPLSLAEIGRRLGISGEWVRRTESRALQKLALLMAHPRPASSGVGTDRSLGRRGLRPD